MQYDTELPPERTILCHTLHSKNQSDQFGFVQPVAEIIDGQLAPIHRESFCSTLKVFITSHYEDLERAYPDRKLFQLGIRISGKNSDNVVPELACKYVASAAEASPIKPKDYFEVLYLPLPPANSRTLMPDELPGTVYIFISDSNATYGPFKWTRVNREQTQLAIEIDFPDAPLPNVSLAQYQTYTLDSGKVTSTITKALVNDRRFLQGLTVLQGAGYLDYASDDEVLRYCAKIAGDQGLRILERARVDALVAHVRRNPKLDNDFNRNRLSRMAEITELTQSVREDVSKAMGAFLNSDYGRPIVQNYIEQNESAFVDKLRKERAEQINLELSEHLSEVSKAESRIAELNDKKTALNDDIQRLSAERDKGADLSQVYAQSDEALRTKRAELEEIDGKIRSLAAMHNLVLNVDEIKKEISYQERKREDEKGRTEQAEAITRGIVATMTEKNSELQRRMADLKPFVDAINGSFSSVDPIQEYVAVATHNLAAGSTTSRQKEVVQAVQAALAAEGRHLQEHETANLLITLQQSFLTIFAGLPGTGKTSLARLMADAQNITPRLREVAVSRGWTSQKDLIGYYNPLTSRFQQAGTGMYSFLKAIGNETGVDLAMAYILLDEANLSPIEHYWSAFMGLTDHHGDRKIILGNEVVQIPDNLRFIATINYDGTTEPLSARLINRAPIIVLDTPADMNNAKAVHKAIETILPIPSNQMNDLFGLTTHTPELDGNERSIYEQIKKILIDSDPTLGRPVAISPRKENAIHQYCAKARILMNIDYDMMALDFAVQQHILPLIQGNGARFAKRLDALRSILLNHDLPVSAGVLQRMIAFGEADLQTYDFFCW
ncbi:MAG: AAA family ATPase [Ferribacterium limneticum]